MLNFVGNVGQVTSTRILLGTDKTKEMSLPAPETLRLYASILRKPTRNAASCSGREPLSDPSPQGPGEIILAAAAALEFQANAIEAQQAEARVKQSTE